METTPPNYCALNLQLFVYTWLKRLPTNLIFKHYQYYSKNVKNIVNFKKIFPHKKVSPFQNPFLYLSRRQSFEKFFIITTNTMRKQDIFHLF